LLRLLFSQAHSAMSQPSSSASHFIVCHCLHTSLFLSISPCLFFFLRNNMSSRRLSRPWSTQFHPQHPITLRCGRRRHRPTAMSARGCCGASPGRACDAQSVASNATISARTCLMQIVYKVRKCIHFCFDVQITQDWKHKGMYSQSCLCEDSALCFCEREKVWFAALYRK